ncbi:putative metal-dependent RNase [Salibacterium salarium]|uniref:hypothetical protein n=1 Tax=Salibacterium salarium TaxID=284579 RepID=UPI0027879ABE|nr:hypothetical protein [Salibacterium salarium]MDQ0300442.1 putative metal-dependent RNase [Salibacterium salarium]
MSKANYPEIRDILLVDITFKDNKTGNVRISQKRPCVVLKKNDDEIALQTITSLYFSAGFIHLLSFYS